MKLLNLVGFQLGWFACVMGAANDRELLGIAAAGVLIGLLMLSKPQLKVDALVVLATAGYGWVADSLQHGLGVTQFEDTRLWLGTCPLWIVALWALFGTTLNGSLQWLQSRLWLAAVLGTLAGPLAYLGGEQLGAFRLGDRLPATLSVAAAYGIAMPSLLGFTRWCRRALEHKSGGRP